MLKSEQLSDWMKDIINLSTLSVNPDPFNELGKIKTPEERKIEFKLREFIERVDGEYIHQIEMVNMIERITRETLGNIPIMKFFICAATNPHIFGHHIIIDMASVLDQFDHISEREISSPEWAWLEYNNPKVRESAIFRAWYRNRPDAIKNICYYFRNSAGLSDNVDLLFIEYGPVKLTNQTSRTFNMGLLEYYRHSQMYNRLLINSDKR